MATTFKQTYKYTYTELNMAQCGINSLDGINTQHKNIECLNLQENYIVDISKLSKLVNLKCLNLSYNRIKNIPSTIKKLKKLQFLTLHYNYISDISNLQYLTNLESLDISCTNITDLTPLSNLTKLKYLILTPNFTTFKTLSPILKLKKLEWLELPKVSIEEVPILFNLLHNNIDDFCIHYTELNTLDTLVNFVKSKSKNIFI